MHAQIKNYTGLVINKRENVINTIHRAYSCTVNYNKHTEHRHTQFMLLSKLQQQAVSTHHIFYVYMANSNYK